MTPVPLFAKTFISLHPADMTLWHWLGESMSKSGHSFVSAVRTHPVGTIYDALLRKGMHLYEGPNFTDARTPLRVVRGRWKHESSGTSMGLALMADGVTQRPFYQVGSRCIYAPSDRTLVVLGEDEVGGVLSLFCDKRVDEVGDVSFGPQKSQITLSHMKTMAPRILPGNVLTVDIGFHGNVLHKFNGKSDRVDVRPGLAESLMQVGFQVSSNGALVWPGDLSSLVGVCSHRMMVRDVAGTFRPSYRVNVKSVEGGYEMVLSGAGLGIDVSDIQLPVSRVKDAKKNDLRVEVRPGLYAAFTLPPALAALLMALRQFINPVAWKTNTFAITSEGKRILSIYARASWTDFQFESDFPMIAPEQCPPVPVSKAFIGQMLPHQMLPYYWMASLEESSLGGILADDMRMGKSIVSIALMTRLKEMRGTRCLVVCPPDVIASWQQKIREFAPSLKTIAMVGDVENQDDVTKKLRRGKFDVLFLSLFSLQAATAQRILDEITFGCVFYDEAHLRKAKSSKAYAAMLSVQAPVRFVLTGTPVENRPLDAWALINLCLPSVLMTADSFRKTFDAPISNGDIGAATELSDFLAPFLVRRTRDSIDALYSPAIENVRRCDMAPAQEAEYRSVLGSFQETHAALLATKEDRALSFTERGEIIRTISRLRQICTCMTTSGKSVSGKFGPLLDLIAKCRGEQFIVFSSWVEPLHELQRLLAAANCESRSLTGALRRQARATLVENFRKGDFQGILSTTSIGGTGIDLPEANHVFILDPWWNPFTELQSAARAETLSKKTAVSVTRFVSRGTIEERVIELQEHKHDVFNAIFADGKKIKPRMTISLMQEMFSA